MTGKQVKVFLIDGTPGGLTTAEITNWTGHVLSARRSDVGSLLDRDEADRTGVYLLLGDDEEANGGVRCYVGEADVVGQRLKSHVKEKDFWDRVITITSKDDNLTKAHCRYLESRLISLAISAARSTVVNGTNPPDPRLPEADRSDMEYFLEQLHVVLPVLGINVMRSRQSVLVRPGTTTTGTDSPVFHLVNTKRGVNASAQEVDGEFTVLAGSTVFPSVDSKQGLRESTLRAYESRKALHAKLIMDGSILVDGSRAEFTRDTVFSSSSAAAAVVQGLSAANGRTAWRTSDGSAFGDWETRGIA
ncbi:GIY-YIG nuclease family protein [Demequina sediminicola]|uniref:GIY-YIG nuclease family protein n=1 Tax=Demequina sediminicola TaxID=1095026 RepID=UPI00078128B3|nr:GIY-YIG nuclease family protein [Demequina sediminicola]